MKFNVNKRDIYERLWSRRPLDVFFDDPKRLFEQDSEYRNEHVGFSENDYDNNQRMGASFQRYYFDDSPRKYPIKPRLSEIRKAKEMNK